VRLENQTDASAKLFSAPFDGMEEVPAFVVAKKTFDLSPAGALTPSREPLPVSPEPIATPFGTFHGEIFPRKDRADFVVLGTARLAVARDQAVLTARLGRFTSSLRLVGDRVWAARGRGEPVPTSPQRFTEMPLSYQRAFGGKSVGSMGEVAWPNNPDGLGFYQTADEAAGKPLPNIEWAGAATIRSWKERPDPAGWGPYPMFWGLRATAAVRLDQQKNVTGISRKAFNHAHPAMVVETITGGERVDIDGVRPRPISFDVPRLDLTLEWTCGAERGSARLEADGLFVWLDQEKVVVTYRARFRYPFRREQRRAATLVARPS